MAITIELPLTNDERRQLAGILHCEPRDLDAVLAPYAAAAIEEYTRMFIGQRVFTRGADIHEYRLFLLMKEPFERQIPDEQRVSDLFQTTASQSRSLIRSVIAKYQYELQDAINSSLKSTVEGAEAEGDDWTVTVNSENIVESLNRVIGSIDGSLPQIEKKRGTVSNYVLRRSSYLQLCERFGLPMPA
ncbi:MAG TPA: hypothetical protein VKT78_01030 [Fimbriimonadaceae bacterium]|nr:hypothetical protein [Fimbriimonadaceae bacterium]